MDFSARLIQILSLLLRSDKHIPAVVLAENLRISKRTIFRELKNIGDYLNKYDLKLSTRSKKGVIISGTKFDKKRLLEKLKNLEYVDPQNKKERHDRLVLELLKQHEPQKIYYYSSILRVSEATISNDLDILEGWFSKNNVNLIRKSGFGVYLNYEEENYRKVCMSYVYQNGKDPFNRLSNLIESGIVNNVIEVMKKFRNNKFSEVAESSYTEIIVCISVITKRILMGKRNTNCKNVDVADKNMDDYEFVVRLLAILSRRFSIKYTSADFIDVYIYIKGSKLQYINKNEDIFNVEPDIRYMVYDIIQQYDSIMAYQLKQDEDLVKGLTAHIKPTLVRLKHGIEIQNPFQDEIKKLYPDIYKKAQNAVIVIEKRFKVKIPESELGLLAIHFGGAEVRLKNNYKLRRKVNLGVICSSGIGISALLSSRISNIFHGKVKVRTLSFDDLPSEKMQDIEILISTFDIQDDIYNYIKVDPMLTEKDVIVISHKIENVLNSHESNNKKPIKADTLTQIERINLVSQEISSIIKNFALYTIGSYANLDKVMNFVSEVIGKNQQDRDYIYNDLKNREELSTQVIPEFQLVFLHTKTKGVQESKFILIKPKFDYFKDKYLLKAKVIVVMLIPCMDLRDKLAISSISNAIFEDEAFLNNIKDGNEIAVKVYIEDILKEYLAEQIKRL